MTCVFYLGNLKKETEKKRLKKGTKKKRLKKSS